MKRGPSGARRIRTDKRPHYSGCLSTAFWRRVNALPEIKRQELYSCGVLLQEMEERVLQWLEQSELEA